MNLLGSLRKTAAADVRRLRTQNRALLAARNPPWLRFLAPLVTNRSLFRLLAAYLVAWTLLVLGGALVTFETPRALLRAAQDLGSTDTIRILLSYMLGAQATMVGLIFPLALGMVTLIVQRDEAAATNVDVQLYYDQSLAYAVGTSGIGLAIALIAALIGPEGLVLDMIGRDSVAWSVSLSLLMILAAWLFANFVVTWQFLLTSLSFITPSYRAAARRRFVAAHVIPPTLADILAQNRYVRLDDYMQQDARGAMPFVMAAVSDGSRDGTISIDLARPRQLADVRLVPLRLAVRLWSGRCRKAGQETGSNKYHWMLGFIGGLGRTLQGDVLLCRRTGGVPFNAFETWLIRHSFVLPAPVEREELGPSDILEELADRVIAQIDRLAVTGFDHALREMCAFHQFLLAAYTIVDEKGVASSYAEYGLAFAEHSNWLRGYGRLFERAIAVIEREDHFLGALAYATGGLIPPKNDNVPVRIVAGLFELPQYMVHRIGQWLTSQRGPRAASLSGGPPGPLPPAIAKAYRSTALRLVGAYESSLEAGARYAKIRDDTTPAEAWATLSASWPIFFKHIESGAYLVGASIWHEDDIATDLYIDSLLQWRERLGDLGEHDFSHILRTAFLSSELVDHDWGKVEAATDQLLLHPAFREATPQTIFSAVLANLHADLLAVTALVLAGWARTPVYDAAALARRLAGAVDSADAAPVLTLVRTFVRLRIVEWATNQNPYIDRLDHLVSVLDAMTDNERVPGRVYSVETRFRVGALSSDWFALVAAMGDTLAFAAIEKWLGDLGDDASAERIGDEVLWDLHTWLIRIAGHWVEPVSNASLTDAIRALSPVLDAEEAGDAFHAVLVAAAGTIEAHRLRRLIAMPIAPEALAELRVATADAMHNLKTRLGLFPAVVVEFVAGRPRRTTLRIKRCDKAHFVRPAPKVHDGDFIDRTARRVAAHAAAGLAWKPYFKLPRRRVPVRSLRAFFLAAAAEAEPIIGRGARPIVLLATDSADWPDFFDAESELGDGVTRRDDAPSGTYLYSYAGIDFHRSGLAHPELLADDLLESLVIASADLALPVDFDAMPDTDPREVMLTARLSVTARWREARIVTFVRRSRAPRATT